MEKLGLNELRKMFLDFYESKGHYRGKSASLIPKNQLGTKVRIAIYETVPGYSVKDVKFYTTNDILTDPSTQIVNNATIFTTTANSIYKEGTYTVSYPTVDKESTHPDYVIMIKPKKGRTRQFIFDNANEAQEVLAILKKKCV